MAIPVQGLVATNVTVVEPKQPFEFLAVTVYVPAANPENVPDAWKVPLFKLYVNPVPPVAEAVILPFDWPVVGFTCVVVTTTIIPAHGLLAPNATDATPVQPFEFFAVTI